MFRFIKDRKKPRVFLAGITLFVSAAMIAVVLCGPALAAAAKRTDVQKSFSTPEEAVKALVAAAKADEEKELLAILGPEARQLLSSGDPVEDKENLERFLTAYDQKSNIALKSDAKAVLEVGKDQWPLPIPIVKTGTAWRFDTKQGKEEILNRRIGRNELNTIQVCLAYVDAQREYASKDRSGNGVLEYAQKFVSSPGKKDGLYWEAAPGQEQSPLGPFAARAQKEGYTRKNPGDKPAPYHGYFFKILKAQGKHAPRGAYDYVSKGSMIGGFAMVAYPAQYGVSGLISFIVSHDGVVYEKDLGRNTASKAQAMTRFDPDDTWLKVQGRYLEPPPREGRN